MTGCPKFLCNVTSLTNVRGNVHIPFLQIVNLHGELDDASVGQSVKCHRQILPGIMRGIDVGDRRENILRQ